MIQCIFLLQNALRQSQLTFLPKNKSRFKRWLSVPLWLSFFIFLYISKLRTDIHKILCGLHTIAVHPDTLIPKLPPLWQTHCLHESQLLQEITRSRRPNFTHIGQELWKWRTEIHLCFYCSVTVTEQTTFRIYVTEISRQNDRCWSPWCWVTHTWMEGRTLPPHRVCFFHFVKDIAKSSVSNQIKRMGSKILRTSTPLTASTVPGKEKNFAASSLPPEGQNG